MVASNDNVSKWVVYTLADSRAPDEIRYIGITGGDIFKRLKGHKDDAAQKKQHHRANWIRSVIAGGGDILISALRSGLSEEEAKSTEIEEIAAHRAAGARLVNSTDGGEGTRGYTASADLCAARAARQSGKKHSEEVRQKISAAHVGKTVSAETRAKISAAKSNPNTETRAKLSAAAKNRKPFSEEHRENISKCNKGKRRSEQARANIIAGIRGRVHSDEAKAKMSATHKARRAALLNG